MPNHIHLLWNIKNQNGKESVAGSFAKYTAHQFKRMLTHTGEIQSYKSDKHDRQYQFWKRDPLAIPISSEQILLSKLSGYDEFNMLTHYKE